VIGKGDGVLRKGLASFISSLLDFELHLKVKIKLKKT